MDVSTAVRHTPDEAEGLAPVIPALKPTWNPRGDRHRC